MRSRHISGIVATAMISIFSGAPAVAAPTGTALARLGANPPVRVLVAETSSSVSIRPTGRWHVADSAGRTLVQLPSDADTTLTLREGQLHLQPASGAAPPEIPVSGDSLFLGADAPGDTMDLGRSEKNRRTYQGRLTLKTKSGASLAVIATLPLEEYLRGVVPSEIGADAPEQAKCAQAVAARSFAVLALTGNHHRNEGYDLCSSVHCQVYSGLSRAAAATDQAVSATRGHILTFEGRPIPAYYAALCGGHTEDIRDVWPDRGSARAYHGAARPDSASSVSLDLKKEEDFRKWVGSNPEVYCNPDKAQVLGWAGRNFRWTREFTADEVSAFVAKRKDIGRVVAIRPGRRGESGRLTEMEFVGEKGTLQVGPQMEIRTLFQPQLRSAAFVVDAQGAAESPTGFVFQGTGSGHGVGMCQTGAMGMANAGKSFTEILRHYYPRAAVEKLY